MAQVMACCLPAPSHYLNQCWLVINEVLWHSPKINAARTSYYLVWLIRKFYFSNTTPREQWVNEVRIIIAVAMHDDVIKWKHFPRYWPFVRGIHRSPANSPHKGQWRGSLMFSLICVWINGWVNNREAVDLRRYRTHYDVTVMVPTLSRAISRQSAELSYLCDQTHQEQWRGLGPFVSLV